MSITSVTIRLDIGDSNSSGTSGGVSLHGEAPSPMDFGSGTATLSQGGVPTPSASMALASGQDMPPTPMSGIGGLTASISEPPAPSHDVANAASAASGGDDLPKPEGDPAGARKGPVKR